MQGNHKRKMAAVLILLTLNLSASIFIALYLFAPFGANDSSISFDSAVNKEHVLYIGMTDKDEQKQIIPTDQALEIVNRICAKYGEGYTATVANGGWVDEEGVFLQETSLVYTLVGADEANIVSIMNDVLTALNQSAILVEKRDVSSAFYENN